MSVTITKEVSTCRSCCYSTNSAREHDDPFTSQPANTYWWCTHKDGPGDLPNPDNEVHKNCPYLKDNSHNR